MRTTPIAITFASILFLPFSIAQGGKLTHDQKETVKDIIALMRSKVTYEKAQKNDKLSASYGQVIHELEEISYKKRKDKADAGDVDEQVTLAQILEKSGRIEEAKYYYMLAAAEGDEEAQEKLLVLEGHRFAHGQRLESMVETRELYLAWASLAALAFATVYVLYRCIGSSRKLKLQEKDI